MAMAPNNDKNKKDWSCCCGRVHVRKAAFAIGFIYIILLVIILCMLTLSWLKERQPKLDEEALLELRLLTELHDEFHLQDQLDQLFHLNEDLMLPKKVYLLCFMTVSVVIFVGILIYGLVKKVPYCVLPFYSWQIIDLIISIICIVLYFHYLKVINSSDSDDDGTFKTEPSDLKLFDISTFKLMCLTVLVLGSICVLKIYAIIVVWRCFKYLAEVNCDEMQKNQMNYVTSSGYEAFLSNNKKGKVYREIKPTSDTDSMLNDSEETVFVNDEFMPKQVVFDLS